jgi:hypothetical protein
MRTLCLAFTKDANHPKKVSHEHMTQQFIETYIQDNLPTSKMTEQDTSCCCPKFDPDQFDEEIEITWSEKDFIKDKTFCFFYIPLNFPGLMKRVEAKLDAASARPEDKDAMVIIQRVDPCSPWLAEVYVASTKENVPNAEMVKLSGTFLTKVYEGPYKDMGKWVNAMQTYVKEKNKDTMCIYARYTVCPKCAIKHGKNHVIMMAQVK